MKPQYLIRKKRDGKSFMQPEMAAFVRGVTDGSWADYQISALLMAMFLNGLNAEEGAWLTQEMLRSGEMLDLSDVDAPKADKHSTGGVGDKTSLIVAPLAASCGVAVPMISGRGLGHTGGTLDKLEAISGYNVNLSLADFKRTIKKCGFAMIGQTEEIAPADRKLYALRDATATIEYLPLIVASIMSKKLAENLDALVLDVKTGSGAFMTEFEESKKLAEAMCAIGNACGVKIEAVITDMNQPLGKFVGNGLEVFECVKILRNEDDPQMQPTRALSVELAARMLTLTKVAENIEVGRQMCEDSLNSGRAFEQFCQNVTLQGGNKRVLAEPNILRDSALSYIEIKSSSSGYIAVIDAKVIGEAICQIGGGRTRVGDKIDYAVGFECEAKIGSKIEKGETLGVLFYRNQNQVESVREKLQRAYKIDSGSVPEIQLIKEIVSEF